MSHHRRVRTIEVDPCDAEAVAYWKRGAVEYMAALEDWGRHYLFTKPFQTTAARVEPVSIGYFRDFANIVQTLDLPGGSRILDVACGPGWFSEFLWRFGYRVVGIDVCSELLEVARGRVRSVSHPPLDRSLDDVRFLELDIETAPLDERFDAVVFYDCLHHFVDVERVIEHAEAMLAPHGALLIKEGSMPPPGSEGDRLLISEAERLRTLEAPFDHEWLDGFLRGRDFEQVTSFIEINGFFERSRAVREGVAALFDAPPAVNVFLCRRSVAASAVVEPHARIELQSCRLQDHAGEPVLALGVHVHNEGPATWTTRPPLAPDTVTIGVRLLDSSGAVLDENTGRTLLPRDVEPGASEAATILYPVSALPAAAASVVIDLVLQGRFWFSAVGARPARVELSKVLPSR